MTCVAAMIALSGHRAAGALHKLTLHELNAAKPDGPDARGVETDRKEQTREWGGFHGFDHQLERGSLGELQGAGWDAVDWIARGAQLPGCPGHRSATA